MKNRVGVRKPQQKDKVQWVHYFVARTFLTLPLLTSVEQNAKTVVLYLYIAKTKEEKNRGNGCSSPHPAVWQTLQECDPACLSVEHGCVRGSGSDYRMAVGRIDKTQTRSFNT